MTTQLRDSVKNQAICSKLVEREVLHCLSSLVDHFAKNPEALEGSDYSQEDIIDLCQCRVDHSERIEEIESAIVDLEEQLDQASDDASAQDDAEELAKEIATLEKEKDDLESEQEEPREVYEHWAVTRWFAEKLKQHGETTGDLFDFHVWGRCTTGQSISMDCVILEIAAEMEILDGQKNSWAE
jgi:hypothetical protein